MSELFKKADEIKFSPIIFPNNSFKAGKDFSAQQRPNECEPKTKN